MGSTFKLYCLFLTILQNQIQGFFLSFELRTLESEMVKCLEGNPFSKLSPLASIIKMDFKQLKLLIKILKKLRVVFQSYYYGVIIMIMSPFLGKITKGKYDILQLNLKRFISVSVTPYLLDALSRLNASLQLINNSY